uniref:retinol dehydrogenase 13-like n=1 Tax=Pristiophorus japonicus TaxID=55135 RepID=UPI00398F3FF0
MELSHLNSGIISLASHPAWLIISVVLYCVVRLQRRGWWRPRECPVDLTGKTAIITGANTGIGKSIALDFAQRNARVILACRNLERGQRAEREIRLRSGNSKVHLYVLDTSSMESVREFSQRFKEEVKQLDILVNNAASSGLKLTISSEGLELTFATNHLGPFLLTSLLLDLLKSSQNARIVNLSSVIHREGEIDFRHMRGQNLPSSWKDVKYSNTKLMNVLFTLELSNQLRHTGVTVNAVHPGIVQTEIMRNQKIYIRVISKLLGIFFFKVSAHVTHHSHTKLLWHSMRSATPSAR